MASGNPVCDSCDHRATHGVREMWWDDEDNIIRQEEHTRFGCNRHLALHLGKPIVTVKRIRRIK